MRENLGTLRQKGREVVRKPKHLAEQRAIGATRLETRASARPADKENSSELEAAAAVSIAIYFSAIF